MAGLGESCSHIATILWAIEAGVQVRNSITVTQKKPIGFYQLLSKMCLLPQLRITSLKGIVELLTHGKLFVNVHLILLCHLHLYLLHLFHHLQFHLLHLFLALHLINLALPLFHLLHLLHLLHQD